MVTWTGGPFAGHIPPEHAKPFRLRILNIVGDKELLDNMESGRYRDEVTAINSYEHFLVSAGAGEFVDGGKLFREIGNLETPPEPPSPDVPSPVEDAAVNEEMGSW
jgi:hypothetical protein